MNDIQIAIIMAGAVLMYVVFYPPKPKYNHLYGYCKKCKKPLYIPSKWPGITPPPVKKMCFGQLDYIGHLGLPCLAGDEIGLPLEHPVNSHFTKAEKKKIIHRYSHNFLTPKQFKKLKK